ncbi:hypothetical protein QYF36_025011 [Acer negundo]|nr:hypothetical protein QYF36_025011 [Acer negundo]
MARNDEALHVVMFPYFAFGHINPFVQLSNRLCAHGVRVSFLSAPGNISRIQSTMKLTPEAEIVPLPIPEIEGLPQGFDSTADMTPAMAEILKQAIDLLQPQTSSLLSQLKPHFVIFDFAQHWVPKVASELGIKTLRFSIFATISDAYVMVPPREKSNTIDDLMRAPNGFPSDNNIALKEFEARDFLYVFMSFHGKPSVYERVLECLNSCTAIANRSCIEMEGDQFVNSKLVAWDMRAGVEVKRREDSGYFSKEDVVEAVNTVMVEVEKEPGVSIRANQNRWRDFLLNKEIQNKYIADLVHGLKALA